MKAPLYTGTGREDFWTLIWDTVFLLREAIYSDHTSQRINRDCTILRLENNSDREISCNN